MEGAATENAAAPVGVTTTEPSVDADQLVEGATVGNPATPPVAPEAGVDTDQVIEDAAPEDEKHRDTEVHVDATPEEMRKIIEVIADTGNFWHDWNFLKGLLSLQLKQALALYSEVQMMSQEDGQQLGLLGETYSELVNRLNDALLRFEEGPPFTLQRLCEILLDPKGTYTKLPKLALALEKNLLVTSTMTKCTDPYPSAHGGPLNSEGAAQITETSGAADGVDVEPESVTESTASVPNGTEHAGGDGDEEMADAEAEEVSCSRDVEMQEKPDQVESVNPDANLDATVATETVNVSEPSSDPQSGA